MALYHRGSIGLATQPTAVKCVDMDGARSKRFWQSCVPPSVEALTLPNVQNLVSNRV